MGFDKATAIPDIAVTGGAADDPGFTDKGEHGCGMWVSTGGAAGAVQGGGRSFWYQPIGFRWAHNLAAVSGERAAADGEVLRGGLRVKSAMVLAKAEANALAWGARFAKYFEMKVHSCAIVRLGDSNEAFDLCFFCGVFCGWQSEARRKPVWQPSPGHSPSGRSGRETVA